MGWISRRTVLTAAASLGAYSLARPLRGQAQEGPIKMAVMVPLSGPFAGTGVGRDIQLGAEIAAKHINAKGGVRGRQIEMNVRDTKGDSAVVVATGRELGGNGVNMFVYGLYTSECIALIPILQEQHAIGMVAGGVAMQITHENYDRHVFRAIANTYECSVFESRIASQKFPDVKIWGGVCQDNPAAISIYEGFRKIAAVAYDKIDKKPTFRDPVLVKAGALDVRNQVSELVAAGVDALGSAIAGQDAVNFFKTANSFGLPHKLKIIADASNEFGFAKVMGKSMPENFWVVSHFYIGLYKDNPLAKALYDDYVALTNNPYPDGHLVNGANAVYAYAQSIEAANGSTDTDTLIKLLESQREFSGPKGNFYFRQQDHQCIDDVGFIEFGPSEQEPGFKVVNAVQTNGKSLVEPPAPGVPFSL